MKNQKTISSVKDLQLKMPKIIEEYGNNQEITVLALANPILALRKIGYQFTVEAEEQIETLIRFGPEGKEEYEKAESEIVNRSKEDFSLRDRKKLSSIVCKCLSDSRGGDEKTATGKTSKKKPAIPSLQEVEKILGESPVIVNGNYRDPLEVYAALDPIIPPLLTIRKLEAENPRLASEEDIPQILQKASNSVLQSVTFELNRNTKS